MFGPARRAPVSPGSGDRLVRIRRVDCRIDPVINMGIVATRGAASACFRLFKPDRNAPPSVRDLFTQLFGLIACMRGVAGAAGSSLLRHIHMPVMKIHRSVPEIGQTVGFPGQNNTLIVAGKAEVVE